MTVADNCCTSCRQELTEAAAEAVTLVRFKKRHDAILPAIPRTERISIHRVNLRVREITSNALYVADQDTPFRHLPIRLV
jgi:hypothetical protein